MVLFVIIKKKSEFDAVLRKQGKFTDEEYEMMKKHSEIGRKMVKEILTDVEEKEFVQVAFHDANYHHEKVNGKGYPKGLKGVKAK